MVDDATDLIAEHDDDKEVEEQGEEEGNARDEHGRDVGEEGAVVVEADGAFPADQDEGVRTSEAHVDQEEEEELLVVETDAVIHPRAVVVHAGHAPFADGAVVALWNLDCHTFLAFL